MVRRRRGLAEVLDEPVESINNCGVLQKSAKVRENINHGNIVDEKLRYV